MCGAIEERAKKSFLCQAPFQNMDHRFKNIVVQCIYKKKQIDFWGFVTFFFVVEGFSFA